MKPKRSLKLDSDFSSIGHMVFAESTSSLVLTCEKWREHCDVLIVDSESMEIRQQLAHDTTTAGETRCSENVLSTADCQTIVMTGGIGFRVFRRLRSSSYFPNSPLEGAVTAALSRCGQFLAAGDRFGRLGVWSLSDDVSDDARLQAPFEYESTSFHDQDDEWEHRFTEVRSCAFLSSGEKLLVATDEGIEVFERRLARPVSISNKGSTSAKVSSDETTLVTTDAVSNYFFIYNLSTGALEHSVKLTTQPGQLSCPPRDIAVSPTGDWILTTDGYMMSKWSVSERRCVGTIVIEKGPDDYMISDIKEIVPLGSKEFATLGGTRTISIWDWESDWPTPSRADELDAQWLAAAD